MLILMTASLLWADERTQKLTARLTEEAAAFERVAPQVLGTETLHQRAQKPAPRLRIRFGQAAQQPAQPVWQQRTLISEYGFAAFSSDSAGGVPTLHELRRVTSVDGRKTKDSGNGSAELAKIILAADDVRKRELLKQFEKYGLLGAANDFGQLILLFSARNIGRYEFDYRGGEILNSVQVFKFGYKQIDGPNPLTVLDVRKNQLADVGISGEIWVRVDNYAPVRVTLLATQVPAFDPASEAAPGLGPDRSVRQEATVDYKMSPYGALLPVETHHLERRAGMIVAENTFTYGEFKRFSASSEIRILDEDAVDLGAPQPAGH